MSDVLTSDIDAEQMVIGFLLDADLDVDGRIYSELPSDVVFPAVRVHQYNDIEVSGPALWLMRYSLTIDVWGGAKSFTRSVASAIRTALKYELVGAQPEGVVTHVETSGLDTTADGTYQKAKPRCRFTVHLWAHPLPDALGS